MTDRTHPVEFINLLDAVAKVGKILFGRTFEAPLSPIELREIALYASTHRAAYPTDQAPLKNRRTLEMIKRLASQNRLSELQCGEARRNLLNLLRTGELKGQKLSSGRMHPIAPIDWANDLFAYPALGRIPPNAIDWDDDIEHEKVYIRGSLLTKYVKVLTPAQRAKIIGPLEKHRSARQRVGGRKQLHHWREVWKQIAHWAVANDLPQRDADLFRKIQKWYPAEFDIVSDESLKKEVGGFLKSARAAEKTASFSPT